MHGEGIETSRRGIKNDQPTKIIPPFCYNDAGIFDLDSNCIMSYNNYKKVKISR